MVPIPMHVQLSHTWPVATNNKIVLILVGLLGRCRFSDPPASFWESPASQTTPLGTPEVFWGGPDPPATNNISHRPETNCDQYTQRATQAMGRNYDPESRPDVASERFPCAAAFPLPPACPGAGSGWSCSWEDRRLGADSGPMQGAGSSTLPSQLRRTHGYGIEILVVVVEVATKLAWMMSPNLIRWCNRYFEMCPAGFDG